MAGRILSLQVQARELGRLRTGYTDGRRPVRSDTWIVSSHAEHYVQAAAEFWGGSVEKWQPQGGGAQQWRVRTDTATLDALLPPGDPLSQSLELWSGGGCARRCDGFTEMQTDTPCVCRAEHGDLFHEQPKGSVCSATTRLNVFLPDMPDVGVFRCETHSFYSAQEIAGAVDLIKSAVGGDRVIPIRLRIEQRQRKSQGQTKKYPVIVMELRGISTGDVLAGSVMGSLAPKQREAIEASTPRAIESAPVSVQASASAIESATVDVDSVLAALTHLELHGRAQDVRDMWSTIKAAGLEAEGARVGQHLAAKETPAETPADSSGKSADDLWAEIMMTVPEDWSTTRVEDHFRLEMGVAAEEASAIEMDAYLKLLRAS